MPTTDELAEQLAAALARIDELERRSTDQLLNDIRLVVIGNKADIAGLSQGQARLERAVVALAAGQEQLMLAVMGLVNKAEATDERLGALSEGVAAHDSRFDQVDARFDQIDERLAAHDGRFDQVDARFDRVDERLDKLTEGQDALRSAMDEVLHRLPEQE